MENSQQPTIDRDRLRDRLVQIARDRDPYFNSAGHFFVREYVRQELQQWGTVETHSFPVNSRFYQNLILDLPGSDPNKTLPILIGAHYDAVPGTPGADDNASGVAALLELAAEFAARPLAYPVRLVAFDMEEYGLLGSYAYAKQLRQQRQPLRLMLSLEMLGYCDSRGGTQGYPTGLDYFYPDRGNFIALVGNLGAIADLRRLSRQIRESGTPCEWLPVPFRGRVVLATRASDHAPFWDCGYRALMVTDTSFFRNPHYHQSSDTVETLDLDFLAGVCRSLCVGLRSLV